MSTKTLKMHGTHPLVMSRRMYYFLFNSCDIYADPEAYILVHRKSSKPLIFTAFSGYWVSAWIDVIPAEYAKLSDSKNKVFTDTYRGQSFRDAFIDAFRRGNLPSYITAEDVTSITLVPKE